MGRRTAVCAVIVCLHALMCACASRAGGQAATPPVDVAPAAPTPPGAPATSAPPSAAVRLAVSAPDECAVFPSSIPIAAGSSLEAIATVGVMDRIDPLHAPRPTNVSERLLFRQLYETLVRADCMGRVVPGLAASWRVDTDGRTWVVTLRDDARFSDGTPVSPRDVRATWTSGGAGGGLRPEVAHLVESVTETGERTLAVRLRYPRIDTPLALAHPDLAIARPVAGSPWPQGTRLGLVAVDATASAVTIRGSSPGAMRFVVAPSDPRDLLDRGVDLVLTRNPRAIDYATTLPSFQSIPLPWQRTYVLITPGRTRGSPLLSDGQREALADDAVRGEARGAGGPFWWQRSDCQLPTDAAAASAGPRSQTWTPRIVYEGSDDVARDLAERFVGLARATSPGVTAFLDVLLPDRPRRNYQRAIGLTGDALASARRAGTDAGYVIAVDSQPIEPCRDLQLLTGDAPWLDPETIVPLVETRIHAIVRRGRHGVSAEWNGGVLIAPPDLPPAGANGAR